MRGDRARPLLAAHVNHGLRGAEADRDEAFCRDLCREMGVSLLVSGGDVRGLARQRGRGLEEAGRILRLQYLEAARGEHDLGAIATGHHRDDQLETIVMRLFRGTGPDGLRGIPRRRERFIRPLLRVSRAQLLDYLCERQLVWREDASNLDGSNVRGRIRRELLPLVQDIFGAGAAEPPTRYAEIAGVDHEFLEALAREALASLQSPPTSRA